MNKNGCESCEQFWLKNPNDKPDPLVDNIFERFQLFQCRICRSFWETGLKSARVIREVMAYKKI
jgi:hypothetical protein